MSDFVQALKTSKAVGASWRLPQLGVLTQKSEAELLQDDHHTEESVIQPDKRVEVEPKEFGDGGMYRCE